MIKQNPEPRSIIKRNVWVNFARFEILIGYILLMIIHRVKSRFRLTDIRIISTLNTLAAAHTNRVFYTREYNFVASRKKRAKIKIFL